MRIDELIRQASLSLQSISDSPRLDAEVLLAHVLQKSRGFLYAHPEYQLTDTELALWQTFITKRQQSVPIAYLIGEREFWSLSFYVSTATLIPRPATESLVSYLLNRYPNTPLSICDLGTGTGAIAISLAHERPQWHVTAVDIQPQAIALAKKNAERHQTLIHFICSNWFEQIPLSTFDIIVSNPPYIAPDDPHLFMGDVRHEPRTALVSAQQGLADIEYLLDHAAIHLNPNGILIFEHGYDQQPQILALMQAKGWKNPQGFNDEEGIPRFCVGHQSTIPNIDNDGIINNSF